MGVAAFDKYPFTYTLQFFVHFIPFNIYTKFTTRRLHIFLIIIIFHEVLLYVNNVHNNSFLLS